MIQNNNFQLLALCRLWLWPPLRRSLKEIRQLSPRSICLNYYIEIEVFNVMKMKTRMEIIDPEY